MAYSVIKREYGAPVIPRGAYSAALTGAYKAGSWLGKKTAAYMQQRGAKRSGASAKVTNAGPITTQHDISNRYRRKPMPKYRRRRWRKFTNKVKHVMLQMNALSTYTVDITQNYSWTANTQTTFGWMLGGTTTTNNDELFQVFREAYGSGLTTGTVDDYKLFIKAIVQDIQISNTGSAGAIVDVYTIIARKSDNVNENLGSQYTRLYAEIAGAQVTGGNANSPASTPFQNGLFLQKWKILNKKEILLGVGQSTTMQMRNAANRVMQGKYIESNPSYIPGYTRAYLFQVRGVPRDVAGTSDLAPGQVTLARQLTLTYGIPPGAQRETAADS